MFKMKFWDFLKKLFKAVSETLTAVCGSIYDVGCISGVDGSG